MTRKIPKFLYTITKEFVIIWLLRIRYFNRYLKYLLEEKDCRYFTPRSKIYKIRRDPGVSGFYRVRNEEKFLKRSVLSHIDSLDEIVIVFNNCSDKTPQIAEELARMFPKKVRVFEYKPIVNPALTKEHVLTPSKSIHGLANYYNYTLSKTTKKVAVKIDADHIACKKIFKEQVERINKFGLETMRYFHGVNIHIEDGVTYVNNTKPFTYGLDCGFFPISKKTYFINRRDCETLKLPFSMYFTRESLGVLFYHLKGLKNEKEFDSNTKLNGANFTNEYDKNKNIFMKDRILLNWVDAQKKYIHLLKDIPNITPETWTTI